MIRQFLPAFMRASQEATATIYSELYLYQVLRVSWALSNR